MYGVHNHSRASTPYQYIACTGPFSSRPFLVLCPFCPLCWLRGTLPNPTVFNVSLFFMHSTGAQAIFRNPWLGTVLFPTRRCGRCVFFLSFFPLYIPTASKNSKSSIFTFFIPCSHTTCTASITTLPASHFAPEQSRRLLLRSTLPTRICIVFIFLRIHSAILCR